MSPLPSYYERPYHKNPIYPQSITYNACPRPWGVAQISEFFLFEQFLTKWLSQNVYRMSFGGKGRGGVICPPISFDSYSELELSVSDQMSPLWSLYEHPFHKNHIYPMDITYNAFPLALGDCVVKGIFVIWPLNYLKKNVYLKICIWWVWGTRPWDYQLPFDLFWLLKSELKFSISIQMSRLWILLRQRFHKNHIYPQRLTTPPPGPGGLCRHWSFFLFDLSTIFNRFFIKCIWGKGDIGISHGDPSDLPWLLKTELELSISNKVNLSEVYTNIPSTTTIYVPRALPTTPASKPWGILSTPEFRLYDLWNKIKKRLSQSSYRMGLSKIRHRGRLVALQSLLTLKKWIITFNFQSNEAFLRFIWASLP